MLTSCKEEKRVFFVFFFILVHPFLLSDEANSGFTLCIITLRYYSSYPHVTTKMSVLEPILFTYFYE